MGRTVSMRPASRRRTRDARGAAAVEFALILPFLLILVFGIIAYGFMLSFRQAISQGAAEGARAAAVSQSGDKVAAARSALNDALSDYGVQCGTGGGLTHNGDAAGGCAIAIAACANDATAQCVTVTVNYDYDAEPLITVPGVGIALPNNLEYTAVARVS